MIREGRLRDAFLGVASVGALLLSFQVKLGLVRGKYLPAGLHAAEASYLSFSSISAFRAAITGPVQHFFSSLLDAGVLVFLPCFLRGRAFGRLNLLIFKVLYNYLPRPT